MLLQIVFGGVSGEIWEVKLFILCFLSCFSVSLNSAFAFLYFRMCSVVMFLLRSCHFFILSALSLLRLLFHHGTFWVLLIGCVWGIALWALERIILWIVAASLFMFVLGCLCAEYSSVSWQNSCQFALSVRNVGLRGVTWRFDVLEVKRVIIMGKWSLPNRLSSVCHLLSICSIGLLKVRSTFVSVLCVLK